MKVKKPQPSFSRQKALNISDAIIQKSARQPDPVPQQQTTNPIKTFPHSTPPKSYRINEQDVYNYVRNSVMQTFKQKTSRNYELVKELTDITVPGQNQVIDRLCKKYSILRKNRLHVFENADVNIQEITNRYVKSRSKQKQKQEQMARLKVDISVNYRYGRKKQYNKSEQFFSLEGNDIKVLQKRHRQKQRLKLCHPNRSESKSEAGQQKSHAHPYISLYQKAQKQVLESVVNNNNNKIDFTTGGDDYPSLFDPEDWEKNKKSIEKLVNQSKPQRKQRIQSAKARMSQNFKPNFYLT